MINILLIEIILNRLKNYILEVIVKVIMLVELFLKIIILKLWEINLEKGVIRNYYYKSDLEGCYKSDCKSDCKGDYRGDYRGDFGSNYKSNYKGDFGSK